MESNLLKDGEKKESGKSLVVAKDLLPDRLMVIPLHDRPMFPKWWGRSSLTMAFCNMPSWNTCQPECTPLFWAYSAETKRRWARSCNTKWWRILQKVGSVARVIQVSPFKPGEPLQVLVQALERFDVLDLLKTDSIFTADVKYWYENIQENTPKNSRPIRWRLLIALKSWSIWTPCLKRGWVFSSERINLSDPGSLADFAASMTTSSGTEIQKGARNIRCSQASWNGLDPFKKMR